MYATPFPVSSSTSMKIVQENNPWNLTATCKRFVLRVRLALVCLTVCYRVHGNMYTVVSCQTVKLCVIRSSLLKNLIKWKKIHEDPLMFRFETSYSYLFKYGWNEGQNEAWQCLFFFFLAHRQWMGWSEEITVHLTVLVDIIMPDFR